MLDCLLMHHLLKAVPLPATLVLVGDVDQLPSVGPGSVFAGHDRIGPVRVVELNEVFRQARKSQIVVNAHLVQQGLFPWLKPAKESLQDSTSLPGRSGRGTADHPQTLHGTHSGRFGFDPVEGIQVLSPMHRGAIGAERLNRRCRTPSIPAPKPWNGAAASSSAR